ncbi:hypothetical protein TeGR_g14808 [Tetraparma gracilis]|uniref:Uncharacterized protein n=1 Tax=Tetraparma gracilis TaxID=2962635 RepID=A0ABQ6MUK2_9STRA|nr:hypothetical protein TeGR_g14808 [Tetraparma gracilis]
MGSERPPLDASKYWKHALLACLAGVLYSLLAAVLSTAEIRLLDPGDSLQMREVFFGEGGSGNPNGLPTVVLCYSEEDSAQGKPMYSAFVDAHASLGALAGFAAVDCGGLLESGSTISSRFGIDASAQPAAVFVAGGRLGKPRQIRARDMKTGYQLGKTLRAMLEPRTAKVETGKQVRRECGGCVCVWGGGRS